MVPQISLVKIPVAEQLFSLVRYIYDSKGRTKEKLNRLIMDDQTNIQGFSYVQILY
jgi:hypothetical protein